MCHCVCLRPYVGGCVDMNECQRETEKVSLRKRKMIVRERESDRGGEKEYERKRVIEDCCVA